MTPGAIMRRAGLLLLVAYVLAGLGFACVRVPTADAVRDTIHARHTDCLARVAMDEHAHGIDALAGYQCARDEDTDCAAHHLEPRCGEWQATP